MSLTTKKDACCNQSNSDISQRERRCNVHPGGFCTSYRAIDPSSLVFHTLEHHQNDLADSHIVSHYDIPAWYNQQRAEAIVDLSGV